MENTGFLFALFILFFNFVAPSFCAPILNSTTDKHALLSFKDSIKFTSNWSEETSVCDWIGVSCDIKHHRVTAVNLSGFGLAGTLSPYLGNLTFLKYLDISSNNFTGFLPFQLSNLHRLKVMNAAENSFMGEIPTWLGKLSQLEQLILYYNSFSGSIPPSLFNSSKLQVLRMGGNFLTVGMCNNIPNLQMLTLSANQLSGEIPSNIWKCSHLEFLSLSINHFRGNIPNEIGRLSMLRGLWLGINDFRGGLPTELGNLSRLETLSIASASLIGNIPLSIFNVSSLTHLVLRNNSLSGSFPSNMGNSLINLERLLLSHNRFNGSIPTSITNSSKLTILSMNSNSFSGSVPNFGNLRLLQVLSIWGNILSGAESPTHELTFLSSLTECRHLKYLEIGDNPLNGILPISIGNFSTSLLYFYAENSNIKGVIPSEIGYLSNLLYLALNGNQVRGLIPPTIGKLKRLQQLSLEDNQLEGSIPSDICKLINLGNLMFDGNNLVGPIPECLGDVKFLREINFNSNQLNSTIPSNFWTLKDLVTLDLSSNNFSGHLSSQLGNFKTLIFLDLSFNQFSGNIPNNIDGCQSLQFLNLSNNKFGGIIPESLGNVRSMVALDLSENNLLGLLPKSISKIQSLLDFNVSYNRLEGEIPDEGCFINFTAKSFLNNSALCGPSRFHVPPCSKNHKGSRVKSSIQHMKYIVLSLVLVGIFIIFLCVLNGRKNQKQVPSPTTNILQGIEWRRISYIELERGTSSFSEANLLGRGGFASVFLVTLSDGLQVAAKVFNLQLDRAVQSFDSESELLSTIRHRNIVHVIGCCSNMEFKALILEYMPNGSLEKWLYSHNYYLDLVQRVKIALDVALALEYLHHGYTFPIVHCDIKPGNVLLDEDMTARVGDFGIAKLFENREEVIQTKTLATIGYAAPEYGYEGKVSTKGDVYSYGILLLEMFTSKKPTDDMFGGEMDLKEWVSEALQENLISEVVEPRLLTREDGHFSEKGQCVTSIFGLAMKCIHISPNERINMIEAVATLQKINAKFFASTRHRRYANTITR